MVQLGDDVELAKETLARAADVYGWAYWVAGDCGHFGPTAASAWVLKRAHEWMASRQRHWRDPASLETIALQYATSGP